MLPSYGCPNCGANVPLGEGGDVARCRFCGTELALPSRRRRELEAERQQILSRAGEWDRRIAEAGARGPKDLLVPGGGCCGVYVVVFIAASLILTAIGKEHRAAVAAMAIAGGLLTAALLAWRREARRRERLAALDRERVADREAGEERRRAIDAELEGLQ